MRRLALVTALGFVGLLPSFHPLIASGSGPGSAPAAQPPSAVEMGRVATASSVAGFGAYIAKSEFLPGDLVWLYAESLRTVRNQRVDIAFTFQVSGPDGQTIHAATSEFSEASRTSNWGAWRSFRLPARAPTGLYTLRVEVLDRQTGGRGSVAVKFTVASAAGMPVDENSGAVLPGREAPAKAPLSAEFEEAFALLRQKQYDQSVRAFRRGLEKEPTSARGYLGLAQAYEGLGAYKNIVEACDKVLALAQDPSVQALGHNIKGVAIVGRLNWKSPDKKALAEAEAEFRAALDLNPALHIARYNIGMVRLRVGDDAEGVKWLGEYLEGEPKGGAAASARATIANPRRARENFAPDFSVVTEDGEHLDLEGLQGKVIVLDFWASWCAPCRETIPYLRGLAKKFRDAPFVLISISSDRDAGAWRDAMVSEKMVWPQSRDASGVIGRAFSVTAIPTTVVIDGEGIIRERVQGFAIGYGSTLDSAVQKALKALKKPGT